MTDFTMTTDADGVASIIWDVKSKSMNVMSTEAFATLNGLIDAALADAAVKGIIITSAKKDFAGGMDLNVIAQMRAGGAQAIFDGVMMMHKVLRKIELAGMDMKTKKGAKPIAAALPGTALAQRTAAGWQLLLRDGAGKPFAGHSGRLTVTSLIGNWRGRMDFQTNAEGRTAAYALPPPPLAILIESDGPGFAPLVME